MAFKIGKPNKSQKVLLGFIALGIVGAIVWRKYYGKSAKVSANKDASNFTGYSDADGGSSGAMAPPPTMSKCAQMEKQLADVRYTLAHRDKMPTSQIDALRNQEKRLVAELKRMQCRGNYSEDHSQDRKRVIHTSGNVNSFSEIDTNGVNGSQAFTAQAGRQNPQTYNGGPR